MTARRAARFAARFARYILLALALLAPLAASAQCFDATKGVDFEIEAVRVTRPDATGNAYINLTWQVAKTLAASVPTSEIEVIPIDGAQPLAVPTVGIGSIEPSGPGTCDAGGGYGDSCSGECGGGCGDNPADNGLLCKCFQSPSNEYFGCRCVSIHNPSFVIHNAISGQSYFIYLDPANVVDEVNECNNRVMVTVP